MRYALIALLAAAGFALASPTPASAQWGWGHRHHHHWRGHWGPRFGFYAGPPAYYGAGRCWRQRVVRIRPSGRRVVRWVTRCY